MKTTLFSKLTAFRRNELHRHPEVSTEERETARRIEEYLKQLKPDKLITHVGGYGIIAVYEGKAEGKEILLRCELDALPIAEVNDFDYKSIYPGKGHKCGHDGHMTILLGVAHALSENRPKSGRVVLLFQPAEENGVGAPAVVKDEKFKQFNPYRVFALHNLPGYPKHKIVCKKGSFTPSVTSQIIKIFGTTAHAAEPENGNNPAWLMAKIFDYGRQLMHNDVNDDNFSVITPVYAEMGEKAYGISAGYGEVHLTIRAWKSRDMQAICESLENKIQEAAREEGLEVGFEYVETFFANQNHEEAFEAVRRAAAHHNLAFEEAKYPRKWGEDFGYFTEHFKGGMFGIGAGKDTPALHNPDYDYPDEITETGIAMFLTLVDQYLNGLDLDG